LYTIHLVLCSTAEQLAE